MNKAKNRKREARQEETLKKEIGKNQTNE